MSNAVFEDVDLPDKVGLAASTWRDDAIPDGTEVEWFEMPIEAKANVSASALTPGLMTRLEQDFIFDFYFRIWVIPSRMNVKNPRLGVDIPFAVWNAYPYPNDLVTIGESGTTGLDIDLVVSQFKGIEYRTVNLQINQSAPLAVNALYTFTFDLGSATFNFIADRLNLLSIVPDVPVKEKWQWLTDILLTSNGGEQRIALRNIPRREIHVKLVAQTMDEVKAQVDNQMFSLTGEALIPQYQYATYLTQASLVGASTIYLTTAKTDTRDEEYALLRTPSGIEQLIELDEVDATEISLATPLTIDAPAGSWFIPILKSIVLDGHSIRRYGVDDVSESSIPSQATQERATFPRPGSATSFEELNDLVILDKRPLANQLVEDQFHSGTRVIDQETGLREIRTEWLHTNLLSSRQYLLKRTNGTDMDFWRDFLDTIKGRKNAFLTPTYREDLYVGTAPLAGSGQLTLSGNRYSSAYFPMASHKHLRLWTTGGPYDILVTGAEEDDDGDDIITFTPPLPIGSEWTEIEFVSFLLKVRLGDDDVELDHYAQDTILGLTLRTVDE
jgi:hypothetical protein